MKASWLYCCDFGHTWTRYREEDASEMPGDNVCPEGHEAVVLRKQPMLDMVQIAIRPAARIVDSVKGQVGHEYEYYLVVTDLHGDAERMSRKPLAWHDVKASLDRFRTQPDKPGTVTPARAWKILDDLDAEGSLM